MSEIKLNLSKIGIIEGDDKRALEDYVDVRCFVQRKNYDEYYISHSEYKMELDIRDLLILAERFIVTVGVMNTIYLDVTL